MAKQHCRITVTSLPRQRANLRLLCAVLACNHKHMGLAVQVLRAGCAQGVRRPPRHIHGIASPLRVNPC